MRANREKTNAIVMTGVMMALVLVSTSLFKVPNPFTQGHLNMSDAMIFLAVMLLGKRNGAIASGVGTALGDILGGYAAWAPWTLVINFIMAYVAGIIMERDPRDKISIATITGMVAGGIIVLAGYYFAGYFLYGNWVTAIPAIPLNAMQVAVGGVAACLIYTALVKSKADKYMIAGRRSEAADSLRKGT